MDVSHTPPAGCATFTNFEDIDFTPRIPNVPTVPRFVPFPTFPPHGLQVSNVVSTSPLSSGLETVPLKTPLCSQCKGQKYGFTAYFHNTKIFTQPPHELLRLVEKSYILRDRLKSFLVTYTFREVETDRIPGIEEEINTWQQDVIFLVKDVICAAEFELDFTSLESAKIWTIGKAKSLMEHMRGTAKLDLSKGRLQEMMAEFRKLWEGVWLSFLKDQRRAQGGSSRDEFFTVDCKPEIDC